MLYLLIFRKKRMPKVADSAFPALQMTGFSDRQTVSGNVLFPRLANEIQLAAKSRRKPQLRQLLFKIQ